LRPLSTPEFGTRPPRSVVALLLTDGDRLCLLRRSRAVGSDRGRWHCVAGFLDDRRDPAGHALVELAEETGLGPADLRSFRAGPVLELPDAHGGSWRIWMFRAEVRHRRIRLNWEHDAGCWVAWQRAADDGRELVPWLADVVEAAGIGSPAAA
jgi:hypothetical protein